MLNKLRKELEKYKDEDRANHNLRFFKTGPGEYGEGRISLGIKTEIKRKIAKKYYKEISLSEVNELLDSGISDYQFIALIILINKYNRGGDKEKKEIINLYLGNTKNINNWDLVDVSAPHLLGNYLYHNPKEKQIIYEIAKSDNLWKKRIAIISTLYFIRKNQFDDTFAISKILLNDNHDLIHKAVGWMLREIGKREKEKLEEFLKENYKDMPRTMLRYAIEKFPEEEKRKWMEK